MTRRGYAFLSVGAIIAAALIWQASSSRTAALRTFRGSRPELRDLVKALGTSRPFEPRLAGGFDHGPFHPSQRSDVALDLSPDVRIAIAQIEKRASGSRSDADWAALGVASLVKGDWVRGLELLEAAAASPIPDPQWLNDLSVAYLLVARQRERADLIPRALAAAELACRLDNRQREAAFNRALALEELHLVDQAEEAWRAYRVLDGDSAWTREADAHLTRLEQDAAAVMARWAAFDQTIDAALEDRASEFDRVMAGRYRLRVRLETKLLTGWADRALAGDAVGAKDQLRLARIAADLLVRTGGDPMAREAVRAIDDAERRNNSGTVRALANAHLAFGRALQRFDEGRVVDADRECQRAESDFVAGNSPYAHWAPVYRAIALYAARRFTDAQATLIAGRTADIDGQYRYLAGRRLWIRGLIASNEGRFMEAVADYENAQTSFQAVGESDGEASVTALLAETLTMLGVPGEAWRYELKALNQAVQSGRGNRWPLILQLGGALCLNADMPAAALHFQDALIAVASSSRRNRAGALSEGYFHRAQIAERLGDATLAREDLTRAKEQLKLIEDEPLRRREEAEVFAAEAEILRRTSPLDAIASANRAIEFFRDTGGETRIPGLYLRRAIAQIAARHLADAERDLSEAIRHFELQRNRLSERQYRASFFQDGWQAFAQMSRVQQALDHGAAAALEYAERGRARTLLEAASNAEAAQPLTADAVQQQLPADTAVLFFVVLDDRLMAWVVKRDRITLTERPIGGSRLRFVVSRTAWLLRQPGAENSRLMSELADLYRELIEPLKFDTGGGVHKIVVVPDGALHALPFAALINPHTGRYLVQDYDVMTAPSLSMLVGSFNRDTASPWQAGKLRAMVVGNPDRERATEDSWLPALPFSEDEARQVAALYPGSTLLLSAAATKRELLRRLEQHDIIHYAGHALVNDQTPGLSRLLLAADSESPHDGSLFVSELSRVRLHRTRLVVLAACSTGTGLISNGEGVQSLARPFLEAGATWVVATFWDIQDKSAADFFLALHKEIARGEWPAAALSRVQRQFIEDGERSRRPPSQWAWAVIIGSVRQPATD